MSLPALKSEDRISISADVFEGTELAKAFTVSQKGEALMSIFHRYNTTKSEIIALKKALGEYQTAAPSYLIEKQVSVEDAIKDLDCSCWKEALSLTEIENLMSQGDLDSWYYGLREKSVPAFEREVVLETLNDVLNQSQTYFARKVDEIFKALSQHHKTNPAHAFGPKMIFDLTDSIGFIRTDKSGRLDDLRNVIAMFLGLEQVNRGATYAALNSIIKSESYGKWHDLDMGAIKIKAFKKGTAHLCVDPDIAWRLNEVLASLYGLSIPEKFKNESKTKKKPARFMFPIERVINNSVLEFLERASYALDREDSYHPRRVPNSIAIYGASSLSKHDQDQLISVLEACGGIPDSKKNEFTFDYDFITEVKPFILGNRCYPDHFSYQFYPTYEELAEELVEMAEIEDGHECCEPSAGTGNIAKLMPKTTVCVEISELRCNALKASGFENVVNADFLEWSELSPRFDRVVANPPYHKSLAKAHIEAAMSILKPGGILTAVIPTTLKGKLDITGFEAEWSEPFKFESKDVSPTVRKLKLVRA